MSGGVDLSALDALHAAGQFDQVLAISCCFSCVNMIFFMATGVGGLHEMHSGQQPECGVPHQKMPMGDRLECTETRC
jgi:hypothetical protein